MKLILRIVNLAPLYLALLLVGSVWKLGWQHAAATGKPWLVKLAGAALYQSG